MEAGQHRPGAIFERVLAGEYERLRPRYPEEAVRWIADSSTLDPTQVVADVGAGTGQLTRRFVELGYRCVAVEPASNQRSQLATSVPDAHVIGAAAEALPFGDAAIGCVTVAQAFHWLDGDRALPEFRRVLGSGGTLAIVWNRHNDDIEDSATTRLAEIRERFLDPGSEVQRAFDRWDEVFDRTDAFRRGSVRSFPHVHAMEPADLAASYATSSDIALLPAERREAMLRAVDQVGGTLDGPMLNNMFAEVHLFEAV